VSVSQVQAEKLDLIEVVHSVHHRVDVLALVNDIAIFILRSNKDVVTGLVGTGVANSSHRKLELVSLRVASWKQKCYSLVGEAGNCETGRADILSDEN
jgi:hypothetical protein